MSKIIFGENEIKELNKNINVQRVSERSITYSDEFKKKFIEEYIKGKPAKEIFEEAGLKIEIIGLKHCEQATHRWMRSYRKDGLVGLRDTRKKKFRPSNRNTIVKGKNYRKTRIKNQVTRGAIRDAKKVRYERKEACKKTV